MFPKIVCAYDLLRSQIKKQARNLTEMKLKNIKTVDRSKNILKNANTRRDKSKKCV